MSTYSKKTSGKYSSDYQNIDDDDQDILERENSRDQPEAQNIDFSEIYKQHIKTLFDKYKDPLKNKLDKKILLADLKEADMSIYCSLLIKRIQNEKKQELDEKEFRKLFDFDIRKAEDFEMVFNIIDGELGNGSESIGINELIKANKIFELGLKQDDIMNMFRFCGNSIETVTMSELKEILIKEEEEDE